MITGAMITGAKLAQAALELIGTPFRLGGRDPRSGLDCVGLLAAAMAACDQPVSLPSGYRLRITRLEAWLPDPASLGLIAGAMPVQPGDVLLLAVGPAQPHLVIAGPAGCFVHAHAGLRRVVRSPGQPAGPVLGHWRLPGPSTQPVITAA